MFSNLLKRQIKRHLSDELLLVPGVDSFLNAVNDSYNFYEQDNNQSKRLLDILSDEYREILNQTIQNEQKIRSVIEASTDAFVIADAQLHIVMSNKAAQPILMGPAGEVVKQITNVFISIRNGKEEQKLSLGDLIAKGDGRRHVEALVCLDACQIVPMEILISSVEVSEEGLWVFVFRDIQRRKLLEELVKTRYEISLILLEGAKDDKPIRRVMGRLCMELRSSYGYYVSVDESGCQGVKFLVSTNNYKTFSEEAVDQEQIRADHEQCIEKEVLKSEFPYYTDNIREEGFMFTSAWIKKHNFRAYLGIPIAFEKKIFGMIGLFFPLEEYLFDDSALKVMHQVGVELGLYLESRFLMQNEAVLQKKLVETAHLAGMVQISTTTLHNVGNLLNSLNTSVSLLLEDFMHTPVGNLTKIAELLRSHKDNFVDFMTKEKKGKFLYEYIIGLGDHWNVHYPKVLKSFTQINHYIEEIKKTISIQQSSILDRGIKESINLSTFLRDLLEAKKRDFRDHGIQIATQFDFEDDLHVDANKLSQIVLNLINNGIDALKDSPNIPKILTLRTYQRGAFAVIEVQDNGLGIEEANRLKIFAFGFTTKEKGHGFGLHSSALLANAMGGKLEVHSRGIGFGALFSLQVPLNLKV